jgi:hypothetical protein
LALTLTAAHEDADRKPSAQRSVVHPHADCWRSVPAEGVMGDPESEQHTVCRLGDAEHQCVADRLDLAGAVCGEFSHDGVGELGDELGCFFVAVRSVRAVNPAISANRNVAAVSSWSSMGVARRESQLDGAFGM